MKEFSLEEYLKNPSRKVVTRDGRNVRIKCTDAKGDRPVIGLIDCKDAEIPMSFTEKGRLGVNVCDSIIDLFFAPEKHEGWININKWPDGVRDTNGIIYHTKLDIPDIPPESIQLVATIKI